MKTTYDFSGYATKYNIRCSDGRTIRKDAFKDCNGKTVPLVWNHRHDGPENILGHALLTDREDGMYCYCSFNQSAQAQDAAEDVKHGDIVGLSIYANKLKQNGGDVLHGMIREVSLVLAGANPGAYIDTVLAHGDGDDESAIVYGEDSWFDSKSGEFSDEEPEKDISHAEEPAEEVKEEGEKKEMAEEKEKTVEEVFNTLTDEQKNAVYIIVEAAVNEATSAKHSDEGDDEESMKHNVFDGEEKQDEVLSHAEVESIFADAKRLGSMKEAVLAHDDVEVRYGVDDIDWLFPEPKNQNVPPEFLTRNMDWVSVVMNGVHHSPFSRIKSMFANLTEDEARAKGYMKGHLKKEQVFSLLKRSTSPTTVYKKQKLDRDDVTDITDFDIVAWIKKEMRFMLDEELARAFLVGDGRLDSDDDKISEDHIRPIWKEAPLFVVNATYQAASGAGAEYTDARSFIVAAIRARKDYKGSGNPILFTTEDMLTSMLLLEDNTGRELYKDESDLARKLRVSRIVTVPVMENLSREVSGVTRNLAGIIVNLNDYNVGADKGGAVSMFDDFDIDYNQMKYLIETRCSGALVKPYSAIIVEAVAAASNNESNDTEG